MRVSCPEVEGNEGQPDDACCIHREPDEFRLIEVLRHLPGLDGVDCADRDENHVVHLQIEHVNISRDVWNLSESYSQHSDS